MLGARETDYLFSQTIFFCLGVASAYVVVQSVSLGALLMWVTFLQAHSSFGKLKASDTSGSCPCLEYGSQQKRRSLSESHRWTLLWNRFVQVFQKHSFPGEVGEVLLIVVTVAVFGYWKQLNSPCDVNLGHCRGLVWSYLSGRDEFAFAKGQIHWNTAQICYCSKLPRTNLPLENHIKRHVSEPESLSDLALAEMHGQTRASPAN